LSDAGTIVDYTAISQAAKSVHRYYTDKALLQDHSDIAFERVQTEYKYIDYVEFILKRLMEKNIKYSLIEYFPDIYEEKLPKAKEIIFTNTAWGVSGVNTFTETLIQGLIDYGYDAYLLFTTNHHRDLDESLMPKVPYKFLGTDYGDIYNIWAKLQSYLEERSPCLFVPNFDYVASSISPKLSDKIGVLGILHSDHMEHYEHAYRLGRYWNNIVCVSSTIQENLLKLNNSFQDKTSIINYGVKQHYLVNLETKKSDDILKIIYIGRIEQFQKRIFDYVEIIEELDKVAKGSYKFYFVGDGVDLEEFRNKLNGYGDSVEILGRCTKDVIYDLLVECQVFSLVSDFEGLPLSILEAVSCLCVPVVTDIESGIGEFFNDKENCLVSPRRDTKAYVENILSLINDKEELHRLATNLVGFLEDNKLSEKDMINSFISLIDDIFANLTDDFKRAEFITFNPAIDGISLPPQLQQI